jgi:hypothetical protein
MSRGSGTVDTDLLPAPPAAAPVPSPVRQHTLRSPAALAVVVLAGIAVAYGVVLRVWLLFHLPVWGDEAIVGLMGQAIDAGHFSAFYWGQHYGGAEPYAVALALKIGGGGEPALNATPAVLGALSAVLVYCVTVAAGGRRLLALAAGAVAWAWPFVVVWQSVREGGFREVAICCGLVALLCSVRAVRGRAGLGTFALLGIAFGVGWWASAEIVYYVLPCLILLVGWWRGARRATPAPGRAPAKGTRRPSLVVLVGGALLGSLPWWYANAHTGFASLQRSSLPANGGMSYTDRLSVFFHAALPLQLGVRAVGSGDWIGGPTVGRLLYAAMLVLISAAIVVTVRRALAGSPTLIPLSLAAGVVVYPFLYAAAPGTGFWLDGRYGIYLPGLLVLFLATLLSSPGPAQARPPDGMARAHAGVTARTGVLVLAAVGVVGTLCLTVAGAHAAGVPASSAFFSGWRNADRSMEQVVGGMRANHLSTAYGDYWTSYDLDFLGGGRPLVSPSPHLDVSRSRAIAERVASSKDPAWLFFAPDATTQATAEFGNPQPGPGPYTEQTFEARLRAQGVSYRVVKLGILDAVVPSVKLTVP